MDTEEKFVWTDQLVMEMIKSKLPDTSPHIPNIKNAIEEFKKKPHLKLILTTHDKVDVFNRSENLWIVNIGDGFKIWEERAYICKEMEAYIYIKIFFLRDKAIEYIEMEQQFLISKKELMEHLDLKFMSHNAEEGISSFFKSKSIKS